MVSHSWNNCSTCVYGKYFRRKSSSADSKMIDTERSSSKSVSAGAESETKTISKSISEPIMK